MLSINYNNSLKTIQVTQINIITNLVIIKGRINQQIEDI